ncbi:hypothetical protein [Ruegeria sp. HKCCD7559]|uniref:hypothetical protein n=1 Tax=Ruegeria sp. HKCCD7559 TaxID=2683005 RepID=UPI00149253DF|nr:hypothetical protein [Ruegeria sp. HKCCD7559]NOC46113.1 hypothetical protein [Ruegeria sp. HKCCD7559]
MAEVPSLGLEDPIPDLLRIAQGREIQIWVEDINSSASPTDLISKVDRSANELRGADSDLQASTLKVLCPLWPENLRALPSELNKVVQSRTVDLLDFSDEEAREAIKKRSFAVGFELTNFEADNVREHLGNDPLLIGLWTGEELGRESEVLASFVANALTEVSRSQFGSVFSLRRSAISVAAWMLENRTNEPLFDVLFAEFRSSDVFSNLEAISNAGPLFREVIQDGQSKLGFPHDRVRDYLFIEAIANELSAGHYSRGYLADPYYTDLVARAAIQTSTSEDFWDFAKINIPLVCFSALKHSQAGNSSATKRLLTICEELVDRGVLQDVHEQVRREIEWQIAGLRGPQFVELIESIRANTHAGREARVINGNVEAAANLCFYAEPYTNAPFRDRLLAHARERHGEKWLENIAVLVSDTTGTTQQNEAALYLAGECADERLAGAVAEHWRVAKDRGDELTHGMLFAAVSCLSGHDEETLYDVFTAWEAMPTEDPEGKDKSGLSDKRYYVGKDCLSGGLRRVKSERTLKPLVQLAQTNEDMGHVVYGCLEGVDHPLAAVFVASRIAEIDNRIEGDDDKSNFLASSRFSFFGSDIERNVRYSEPALRTLQAEWENTENEFFFRKRCFQLWRESISMKHLRRLAESPPKGLEEELLFTRCRLGDVTAVADLRKKIEQGSTGNIYWFQLIRHFDSRLFEDLILKALEEYASAIDRGEKPDYFADSVITDILADRRDKFAVNTMIQHWDQLKHRYNYPHVLLSIAAPETLSLHARHFETIEDKNEYFKLLGFAYGFRNPDRPGITDVQQLEALEPYLEYFESRLIDQLWDECKDKGFDDWRREHLDGRLSQESWAFKQINDEAAFRNLDEELAKRSDIEMAAYLWSSIRRDNSISPRTLINRAVRYAESRATNEAAEFFAELLALVGTRADLQLLSKPILAGLLTRKQVDGATFAVQKRSLI